MRQNKQETISFCISGPWVALGIRARGSTRSTGTISFVGAGQMSILFSCCVHRKDVAESLQGQNAGAKPPEAETVSAFKRAMKATNFPVFLIFENAKKLTCR